MEDLTFDNQTLPKALVQLARSVPELTRITGIQLNKRVSLRRRAKAASLFGTGYCRHIRTQRGEAVGRSYSARRLCLRLRRVRLLFVETLQAAARRKENLRTTCSIKNPVSRSQ
jgi:hypothetical protein